MSIFFVAESSSVGKSGGCFPGSSKVLLEDGTRKKLSELRHGERVAALNAHGDIVYSEVIAFLDRVPLSRRQFVMITTATGRTLKLTASHLLPTRGRATVYASTVKLGDEILTRIIGDDDQLNTNEVVVDRRVQWDRVVQVNLTMEVGAYAPMTSEGTVLVDDVVASCYAVVNSQAIAHYAFAPLRLMSLVGTAINRVERMVGGSGDLDVVEEQQQGIHWYASLLYYVGSMVLPGDSLQ